MREGSRLSVPREGLIALSETLRFEATAGLRLAAAKIPNPGCVGASTIAAAAPLMLSADFAEGLDSHQSTVTVASDIYTNGHRIASTVRGSSDGPALERWPVAHPTGFPDTLKRALDRATRSLG